MNETPVRSGLWYRLDIARPTYEPHTSRHRLQACNNAHQETPKLHLLIDLLVMLKPIRVALLRVKLLIRKVHLRQPAPHSLRVRAHNAAVPSHLALLVLDVCGGALACNGVFVSEYEDTLIFAEEAVDILEFAVGGFGVKSEDINALDLAEYGMVEG